MKDVIKAAGDTIKYTFKGIDDISESAEERQEQLSNRHELDMVNGTWLTKNVRPLVLLTLLFYWVGLIPILLAFGVFIPVAWISSIEMLSLAVFTFYFGSRGFEKVQMIKHRMKRKNERRRKRKDS